MEITKEYTNKDDRKNVIRNHKKDVCNSVNKIVSGQNTHYVYIPSDGVCHPRKNGHKKASKNEMNRRISLVYENQPHLFHGLLDNEPLPA